MHETPKPAATPAFLLSEYSQPSVIIPEIFREAVGVVE
jgi:hypothetical protein